MGTEAQRTRRGRAEAGMVTAETALALPAVVGVLMVMLWLLSLGVSQGLVSQGAREGARAAARGDGTGRIHDAVSAVAPGAQVTVRRRGEVVVVTASLQRKPPLGVLRSLGRTLQASAVAHREEP